MYAPETTEVGEKQLPPVLIRLSYLDNEKLTTLFLRLMFQMTS